MRKRISRKRLVKFLKQQGFTEYPTIETYYGHGPWEEWEQLAKDEVKTNRLCYLPGKVLDVYTDKGSFFCLDGDFSAFSIGTFHVDIDTERDVFGFLLYELFGHVKVDGDDISAWYTTDEYEKVVGIRNEIIGKAA